MIKTQRYNDFSSFDYNQRSDYNFMLTQLRDFHKNGGDVTLMVRDSDYKYELISFRDYVMKNIKEPESFFKELMDEGILPGLCDFDWDEKTGIISEKKDYGLRWMKENHKQFEGMIKTSISNLLKKLPDDISKIKKYTLYDYRGQPEEYLFKHPLFKIATDLENPEIYDMIFTSKPEIKKEWMISRRKSEEQPEFVDTIGAIWNGLRNPEMALVFYKHNICKKYLLEIENKEKLQNLIKYAAMVGNIDFLNEVLPKVKLSEIEKDKSAYSLSLTRAKNKETVELLLKHGAIVQQKYTSSNGKDQYETNILFAEELRNFEIFETILDDNPKYKKLVVETPEDFFRAIIEKKSLDFIKPLIEKYNFPLEKFDMLSIAYKQNDANFYKWILQHGADIRECSSFCSSIVSARDEGLKTIRALNKEGIIVAKSPDIIFNIFNNKPTKIFLNYYDKVTAEELEKTTKNGFPAWWGACQTSDYSFMYSRTKNYTQTAQDGMPLLFYVLKRQLNERGFTEPVEVFKTQLAKIHKKDPNFKFDFSYEDSHGNNIFHVLLKTKEYRKDTIDLDLLKLIKDNCQQDIYELLNQKNNNGITPLENLLLPKGKNTTTNWNYSNALKFIFNETDVTKFNFSDKLSNGKTIRELFLEHFKNDPEGNRIHAIVLDNELDRKEHVANKKMKI